MSVPQRDAPEIVLNVDSIKNRLEPGMSTKDNISVEILEIGLKDATDLYGPYITMTLVGIEFCQRNRCMSIITENVFFLLFQILMVD